MPLEASSLASLVFTDHLASFPTALAATRENPATGVVTHNVPDEFIKALCSAFVDAVKADNVTVLALVTGAADVVPFTPVTPVSFSLPGVDAAVSGFLLEMGWTGESGAAFADVVIGSVLRHTAELGLLQMDSGKVVGTGTGVVSPASNPGLAALLEGNLNGTLVSAFTDSGYFGQDDIPGNVVNDVLAAQLPTYASWLAKGFATIVASPAYVGNGSVTSPATEIGTGAIT